MLRWSMPLAIALGCACSVCDANRHVAYQVPAHWRESRHG